MLRKGQERVTEDERRRDNQQCYKIHEKSNGQYG